MFSQIFYLGYNVSTLLVLRYGFGKHIVVVTDAHGLWSVCEIGIAVNQISSNWR